ncbi:MAG: hypothetical protein KGI98_01205 [Euryarchaeota archaeon]|nr:hypothetical protein [Euryarchaeota archaeon]
MIYRNRDIRLFRSVVVSVSFATLAVAALTYVQCSSTRPPSCGPIEPQILVAVVFAVILYGVGEWLLPVPLEPPRTPTPQPKPPRMRAWRRGPARSTLGPVPPSGEATSNRKRR